MAVKYLSNRLKNLKVGISNYSEDKTSVIVTGHLGIGTDDATAQVSVANTSILAAGIVTAYQLYSTLYGEFKGGSVTADNIVGDSLSISGISTLGTVKVSSGIVTATSGIVTYYGDGSNLSGVGVPGISTTGTSTFERINVTGVSTFGGLVNIDAGGQANTFKVEDLTDNRVVIAGSGGELEDSANLTFDGSTLAVTGDATFSGNVSIAGTLTKEDVTNIDSVGLITARSGVRITAGGLVVTAGVSTFAADIKANGNIVGDDSTNISGINSVTATTYYGSGVNLTGVSTAGINTEGTSTFENITVNGNAGIGSLNVTGVSTFVGITTQQSTLFATQVSVAGVSTFGDDVTFTGASANAKWNKTLNRLDFPNLASITFGNAAELEIYTSGSTPIIEVEDNLNLNANKVAISTNLTVGGASTFTGNITANGNIVGDDSTNISGINSVTATKYYGDGSQLTGTGGETLITGITVQEESSTVGTGGSITILDFQGADITASASGSNKAIITVAAAVGGLWESNATGIHTLTNVGIGTTTASPATLTVDVGTAVTAVSIAGTTGQLLTVNNKLIEGSIFSVNDVSGIPSIDVDADGTIQLAPTGTTEMVGIGTTNPTSKLHVFGDVYITGVITATAGAGIASATILTDAGIDPNGTSTFLNVNITGIATAADFNSSSDIKLKTNVQRISDPLDKIIRIEGVSFNWKKDNSPSIGVIANELEKVLPELVTDSDPKAVNYNGLIGVLIEAVKEQQSEIDSLKERISKLE